MGVTVRQKVTGKGNPWWVFVAHNNKRTSRMVGDKKAAEEVASKIRARLELGGFDIEAKKEVPPTLKEFARKWLDLTVASTCKESTGEEYRKLLNRHILPAMGERTVTEISRGTIKEFLMRKLQEGLSASTVLHLKNCVSGVLSAAVDAEAIPINPCHKLGKLGKPKGSQEEMDCLTREELKLLLDTAQKYYPKHYPLLLVLARTGMRIGEALALQWGDIDFNGQHITISRGLYHGKIDSPKNGKSRRVDMSRQLTETLQALKNEPRESNIIPFNGNFVSLPRPTAESAEWIFPNGAGGFIDPDNWRKRIFHAILRRAGLRRIRVHDLRHTYASLLIQDGQSLVYVRDQLGHYSIKITVDTYGHLVPGGNKEAVDRLDDIQTPSTAAPICTPGAP